MADRFAHLGGLAGFLHDLGQFAGSRRGQFDSGFVGLDDSPRDSSFATAAPSPMNQAPISTSVIDSPTAGTFNSIVMIFLAKRFGDQSAACLPFMGCSPEPVAGLADGAAGEMPANGSRPKSRSPNRTRK